MVRSMFQIMIFSVFDALINSDSMDTKFDQIEVLLHQNYEKHINVNKTMVETFETLTENDGKSNNYFRFLVNKNKS